MIGFSGPGRKKSRDEAEKPFWISFSDLMTALMVLFLVSMAVALLSVTQGLRDMRAEQEGREKSIGSCMQDVDTVARRFPGVVIREHSIDFGTLANFDLSSDKMTAGQQEFLRRFVPLVLSVAKHPSCDQWLKRVVVEGFASQEGSYLFNLDLSMRRSERVLCALLDPVSASAMSEDDRRLSRRLFLVGGSSFNSIKKTPAESRRIEMKLEFYDLKEPHSLDPTIPWDESPNCPIDNR